MLQRTPHRLQERWFTWLVERNRKGTVRVLWITLALYPTFGVLDYLLAPHTALPLLYGTRAFVTLLTLVLLRVVRRPLFERHSNLISSSFIFLAAGGISLMTVFMGGLESPYYAGLSLVIVGTGLLFVWPPKVVLSTHALIVASFVIPNLVYVREAPGMVQSVSNLFFLMSTAIIVSTGQFFTFRWQREQQVAQIVLADTKANLEKAHEQLKQLDRFKSQFFANITHEFKTPLAMILSPLELLLHGEGGEIGPTQRVTFEMMFRSGMKLLKMIGDLLDLSKLEESRLRLKIGEHDLAEQLRALCDQVQPLALRERLHLIAQRPQLLRQVVLADLQAQPGLLQLREIEQVADHLEKLHSAAKHHLEGDALGGPDLAALAVQEQLQRREDHRQRRLELVGDVGEELRLEPIQLLELLVRFFQIRLRIRQHDLCDLLFPLPAEGEELPRAHDDGGRHEKEEIRDRLHHPRCFPDVDQVGNDERGDDQGVGREHYLGGPHEE